MQKLANDLMILQLSIDLDWFYSIRLFYPSEIFLQGHLSADKMSFIAMKLGMEGKTNSNGNLEFKGKIKNIDVNIVLT